MGNHRKFKGIDLLLTQVQQHFGMHLERLDWIHSECTEQNNFA